MKTIIFAFSLLFVTSCASTFQYSKMPESEISSNEKAKIYVIRPAVLASAINMKIYENDKLIGKLGPQSYLCWELEEGEVLIKSKSENKAYFTVNAKPGKTYYLKQKVKIGALYAKGDLELMTEDEGQLALSNIKKPKLRYTD